jgi:hypothetical protein
MGLRRQPVHTRSKTRIRPAVSSTAKTMNPKSPTSATRRRGTPVGPLNTGSYGSSQILAISVTSMSNPCSGRPCICRSAPDSRCGRYFTLGTAQADVIFEEHPAAGPGERCFLRLVEAGPACGDHHPAPEPQDPPQLPPPGRISRTIQGFPVGGEEVRTLPVRQFPEDSLRVQRFLVMLSGLGAHGVIVRFGAVRMPAAAPSAIVGRPPASILVMNTAPGLSTVQVPGIRTLASLTRSRGAKRGANDRRHGAAPGHIRPLRLQPNSTSGGTKHLLATLRKCLLSSRSRVRVAVGAQFIALF